MRKTSQKDNGREEGMSKSNEKAMESHVPRRAVAAERGFGRREGSYAASAGMLKRGDGEGKRHCPVTRVIVPIWGV